MQKKKLLFHSNFHNAFTGFGKNCKNILTHLYSTGKYDIVELATGISENSTASLSTPWKVRGGTPSDPDIISQWQGDPKKQRAMSYGAALIDKIVKEERPDIYIGAEDIWAFDGFHNKPWWNKCTCVIWTTIDSLPLLPAAIDVAPHIKTYLVWSSFAEKAFRQLGFNNVKTLRGTIATEDFFPLPLDVKKSLKSSHSILPEDFIIGFVFRNQLRKSVPNLLDGFKLFTESNPSANAKLLLHTNWSEGWEIPRLIKEKGINPELILTTYLCSKCKNYEIKPFNGQNLDCSHCGEKKSQSTTNVKNGVSEAQLNEIYNLMDVYCHPFTSGGQEIPVQEAKLTELITLVTNYSCGEDLCTTESAGLPLEWSEYREPGTQFIKATTKPSSISSQLNFVFNLTAKERLNMGRRARGWTLGNFSKEVVGRQLEAIIDSSSFCDYDFDAPFEPRNPDYNPPGIPENGEWIKDLYKNILRREGVTEKDEGYKNWLSSLNSGLPRSQVLSFFKDVATKENASINSTLDFGLEDLIDDKKDKRLIIVLPHSIGDIYLATSLLPSISSTYPDYAIYFATDPQNFIILEGNPHIYKVIKYQNKFDDLLFLEGAGQNKGFFDIAFLPHLGTQKMFNYQHNGCDKIQFDLCT